jgi:hypothetical protein
MKRTTLTMTLAAAAMLAAAATSNAQKHESRRIGEHEMNIFTLLLQIFGPLYETWD